MQLLQLHRFLALAIISFAFQTTAQTTTRAAGNPQSTACGEIVNDPKSNDESQIPVFYASLIYECLTSVPFNAAVATQFIQYYNDTLQFQSTLEYLKNPPTSYQQPGVDLVLGLETLQLGVSNGVFTNQYEFEAALQSLLLAAHDSHLTLFSGILAAFSFGSPWDLVSVSTDGVEVPKVYIAADIEFYSDNLSAISPVKTINGVDVVTYLENFAAQNNLGALESHTDWNSLFFSAAQSIQGISNVLTGDATFYPGDTITHVFENGSSITDNFLGVFYSQGNTGPLQTGGDFFNFFVLGQYPDSYDPDLIENNTVNITELAISSASAAEATSTVTSVSGTSTVTEVFIGSAIVNIGGFAVTTATTTSEEPATSTSSSACTATASDFQPYPVCTDVAQADIDDITSGVTGYFLHDASVAVLSIPSFVTTDIDDLADFDAAIADFITSSKAAGLTKVVIDLQANEGGEPLLAISAFKHFFPNIDPFGGSRLRATTPTNVMGQTLTNAFTNLTTGNDSYLQLVDSEWVSSTKINANTNQNFTSWPEFFGPLEANGGYFTNTQRYDLNNEYFVTSAFGDDADAVGNFSVFGYGAEKAASSGTPAYEAEDIIMLSDGICASACSLFMEMMHHEAGVRAVAVGGRPTNGPMQAPAGTRGAVIYNTDNLDFSIATVKQVLADNNSPRQGFLPDRSATGDVYITFASVNLRDQVRKNETTPLQFAYEAADCRIFYTPQTVFNYTKLWTYAADAIWTNPKLCVTNSTGFATAANAPSNFATGPTGTVVKPQVLTIQDIVSNLILTNSSLLNLDSDTTLYDFGLDSAINDPPTACTTDAQCQQEETSSSCLSNVNCNRRRCVEYKNACGVTSSVCLTACTTLNKICGNARAMCTNKLPVFFETAVAQVDSSVLVCPYSGVCMIEKNGRKKVVGAPIKSKSTSGGTKSPTGK